MRLMIFVASLLFLLGSSELFAKVYKWTDENGKVHYSDKPFEDKETKEVELNYSKANHKNAAEIRKRTQKIRQQARTVSNNNRSSSSNNRSNTRSTSDTREKDKKRCQEYTERYERYKREGVVGVNLVTGKQSMMQGESKRQAIENAKENAKIFCNL